MLPIMAHISILDHNFVLILSFNDGIIKSAPLTATKDDLWGSWRDV